MKRVLIIGNSPLPTENTKSRPAAGLRTWQFLSPLLKEGGTVIKDVSKAFSATKRQNFNVKLITIAMPECYDQDPGRKEISNSEKYSHLLISKNDPKLIETIQTVHDEFHPDVIISINTYPSFITSQLNTIAPIWADLNGWVLAEAQAQAYKKASNDLVPHYLKMEHMILDKADKFSAVSKPQLFALYGELAMIGRQNKETFGYNFVDHIPNGTEWFDSIYNDQFSMINAESSGNDDLEKGPSKNYFQNLPQDAFMLFWLGGYNTWVDEISLFRAVEDAMSKCEKLYFVSTGGEIAGLDNKTFSKFKSLIDESKYKGRFLFLGWVDTNDIPHIYKRANCGINVDRKCTETITGARNRLNEMMKYGLPIVTTLGSEISYEVENAGAGIGAKNGDHESITEGIVSIYNDWLKNGGKIKMFSENGKKYIQEKCNYDFLMKPLLSWLENPRPAPDRGVEIKTGMMGSFKSAFRYLKDNGLRKFFRKFWQKI